MYHFLCLFFFFLDEWTKLHSQSQNFKRIIQVKWLLFWVLLWVLGRAKTPEVSVMIWGKFVSVSWKKLDLPDKTEFIMSLEAARHFFFLCCWHWHGNFHVEVLLVLMSFSSYSILQCKLVSNTSSDTEQE